MALHLVTAPVVEPVTLAEIKAQCRVDHDDENELLNSLIVAARETVETLTGRALMTQTWDWKFHEFPEHDEGLTIPLGQVTSITSITYLDTAGASQTWSSSDYRTDIPTGPKAALARIEPGYGISYPSTYDVMNAIAVRFVAGYGSTPETVPSSLCHAIKLLVAHWYQNREAIVVSIGGTATELPLGVSALIWPYKVF